MQNFHSSKHSHLSISITTRMFPREHGTCTIVVIAGACLVFFVIAVDIRLRVDRRNYLKTHKADEAEHLLEDITDRLEARRQHVEQVCQTHLTQNSVINKDPSAEDPKPGVFNFLVDQEYGLVWCRGVLGTAEAAWLRNFDLLMETSDMKDLEYLSQNAQELQDTLRAMSTPPTIFIITQHPLLRLVDAYLMERLVEISITQSLEDSQATTSDRLDLEIDTFSTFVKNMLEKRSRGQYVSPLLAPHSESCPPCLIDFHVFAKVETLAEDEQYITNVTGIRIIPSQGESEATANIKESRHLLCQLSQRQMDALLEMYKLDLLLFDYDADLYTHCPAS